MLTFFVTLTSAQRRLAVFLQEKNYLLPAVILSRKSAKANADFFR